MLHFLQERLQQLRLLGQGRFLAWGGERFYFQITCTECQP